LPPDHFRSRARAEMHVVVRWRPASAAPGSEVDTTTRNLGVGGAFLPTPVPLPAGTEVAILLSSPTSWDPIEIPGVVRWVTEPGTDQEPGMGVQFLQMSAEDVVRLNDLLSLRWEEEG
jgi:uncharacterized protein (TIGR02266 family)